ncbi:uncharacterized protein B0H18DRAFT_1131757 [Fomitopsis serialis]|uniref:uncharacterized protein n=1 Tax=Fomitopsis serialis TaxID=139415 RepID=UPI002007E0D5|nr:uncharacterized protein B0H18DRAFT_1131757 [Neoantrodia serialis]KAH9907113.1 hypothetical protein B0H18DRAFT_1131757 [Neoantrodia serialis]
MAGKHCPHRLEERRPEAEFQTTRETVATAFEQEFDINVRGLVREKGNCVWRQKRSTRNERKGDTSIRKWIENNKPWFDKHKSGPLDLLPVHFPKKRSPRKPATARRNGELVTALDDSSCKPEVACEAGDPRSSTSLAAPPDATDLAANERSDAPTETAEAAQGSPQTDGEGCPTFGNGRS